MRIFPKWLGVYVKQIMFFRFQNGARVNNGNELDLRMMIHQSQAGCVIGKAGYKIKEIREASFIRVFFF